MQGQKKKFFGVFRSLHRKMCGMVVTAKLSQQVLSMVVDSTSTFLVGVSTRFGRQKETSSN